MKRLFVATFMAAVACFATSIVVPAIYAKDNTGMNQVLRHTVLFRYKDTVTPEQKEEVIKRFAALQKTIPTIQRFEGGPNVEGEKLGDGFEHVFSATFTDAATRDAYLVHPDHKAFGAFVGPLLDKVIVGDYMTKE